MSPREKLQDLLIQLDLQIDQEGSSYLLKKQAKQIEKALNLPSVSDDALDLIYQAELSALSFVKLYRTEREDHAVTKCLLDSKNPATALFSTYLGYCQSSVKALGSQFEKVYQKAKKDGDYPANLKYFDWLWHEYEVMRMSLKYNAENTRDEFKQLSDNT